MNEITYKQKYTAIPVIVISYIILAFIEYSSGGLEEFNWFGMSFLGILAILGILRIGKFGVIGIDENTLTHYNWLFQKQKIKLEDIKEVDVKGLWLNSLKITRNSSSGKSKAILLGTFTGGQLISLVQNLQDKNNNITLGERLTKTLNKP